jgi:hypothetical protein
MGALGGIIANESVTQIWPEKIADMLPVLETGHERCLI